MSLRRWLPLLLFAGFLALAGWQLTKPRDDTVASRMIGKPLPRFDLPAALPGGQRVSSGSFADGKARLLNVWASWCLPCVAEAPQLAELQRRGADIVGIAIKDRPENVARFLATHGNPYSAIGRDDRSSVQLAIGSSGVPETFVVDGKGVIRYQHIGDIRPEHVDLLLAKLAEAK